MTRLRQTSGHILTVISSLVLGTAIVKADVPSSRTVLKTFTALNSSGVNSDGAGPDSRPAIGMDGLLYGMTNGGYSSSNGGGEYGNGVIYRFNPSTRAYTVLHAFSALDATGTFNADGAVPGVALVRGPDDAFYGVAQYGGEDGNGTVFRITASGQFRVLHTFSATSADGTNQDGANPLRAVLFGTDGNLYGTTRLGGPHAVNGNGLGVAWMMEPHGSGFTVIHPFTADEGHAGSLIQARDGFFYGCAVWPTGKLGPNTLGAGTLFRLAPGYYETLYTFGHLNSAGINADGAQCYEPLVEVRSGEFFGSMTYGGPNGTGTVIRFSLRNGTPDLDVLHAFGPLSATGTNSDGANPQARLVAGPRGALYSTASSGGAGGTGVVYRISYRAYQVLYSFSAVDANGENHEGAYPDYGVLVASGDHDDLYGTAANGGANGNGTVYSLDVGNDDH